MLLFNSATVESFGFQSTDTSVKDFSTSTIILMSSNKTVKKVNEN